MILLLMPVIQIILFGFAMSTEVKNTKVVVLANQSDEVTRQLIERIDASQYFEIAVIAHNSGDIDNAFRDGTAKLAIIFENGFSKKLTHDGKAHIQLIADATDPNAATSFVFYAGNIINSYRQELMPVQSAAGLIQPEVKMLYNPQMISAYNFVPGVLGMIMLLILRNDDFYCHSARKGNGNHGNSARFAYEAHLHHAVENCSLFCAVGHQLCNHNAAFGICTSCARVRKFYKSGACFAALYICFASTWTAYFNHYQYAACSYVYFGNGFNAPRNAAFGHDFSH